MKIAAEKMALAALLGVGLTLVQSFPARAEEPVVPRVAPPTVGEVAPLPPSDSAASTAGVAVSSSPPVAVEKDKDEKGGLLPPPKVPDTVKSVVKRLNSSTQSMTLEDLNAAREAIAKLDVLIDIENRLTNIANIRRERGDTSLEGAIPASALGKGAPTPAVPLPQSFTPPPIAPSDSPPEAAPSAVSFKLPSSSSIEVVRIVGASGRYTATLKLGGRVEQVREGDKVSDGSQVKEINSQGVILVRGGKPRTLRIKDINRVSRGSL